MKPLTQSWIRNTPAFYISGNRVNEEVGYNYQILNTIVTPQQEWIENNRTLKECAPEFFISPFDACCERCVIQRHSNNLGTYLHHTLRDWKNKISILESTNALEDFGFTWEREGDYFVFNQTNESVATYSDGEPRKWSGETSFKLLAWKMVEKQS